MSAFETLIFEKKGDVAHVTLNRPEVLNIHNVQMRDDMFEVLAAVKNDLDIRAVVFSGAGEKAFCAGADLSEFLTSPPPMAAREVRLERDLWGLFLSMPQPLIAAVHGYVLGSGIEIALCCDLRVSADNARFGLPEIGLGMIPAAGGTQTVPRIAGLGKALDMLLTNRWIDAREALETGLVNKVVAPDQLLPEAEEMARKIASKDPRVIRSAKQAVRRGLDLPLVQGLELEKRLALNLRSELR
ncbi:MAG: enoyl-CoA hydratase/isomerase family protein [Deltaproteobacteria bacterium]|nr:enoyl-CoA hydratase/isomerase family protein [Deltaproteobacteria bacterium]